jgi:hypothetical protein
MWARSGYSDIGARPLPSSPRSKWSPRLAPTRCGPRPQGHRVRGGRRRHGAACDAACGTRGARGGAGAARRRGARPRRGHQRAAAGALLPAARPCCRAPRQPRRQTLCRWRAWRRAPAGRGAASRPAACWLQTHVHAPWLACSLSSQVCTHLFCPRTCMQATAQFLWRTSNTAMAPRLALLPDGEDSQHALVFESAHAGARLAPCRAAPPCRLSLCPQQRALPLAGLPCLSAPCQRQAVAATAQLLVLSGSGLTRPLALPRQTMARTPRPRTRARRQQQRRAPQARGRRPDCRRAQRVDASGIGGGRDNAPPAGAGHPPVARGAPPAARRRGPASCGAGSVAPATPAPRASAPNAGPRRSLSARPSRSVTPPATSRREPKDL